MSEESENALRALAAFDVDRVWPNRSDDTIIWQLGEAVLRIGHVRDARIALGKPSWLPLGKDPADVC